MIFPRATFLPARGADGRPRIALGAARPFRRLPGSQRKAHLESR